MKHTITFKGVNDELNVPRLGGKSLLPSDIHWPVNPNGKKLTLILSLPTSYLNSVCQFNYPADKVISVFTTYDSEDYFLDVIGYHGNEDELEKIKSGFTKVILHTVGNPRNESDYLIPANEITANDELDDNSASFIANKPELLQNEILALDTYNFCMQLYGDDFPEGFDDIFYLSDSYGYLYLSGEETSTDTGIFFTQCT